MDDRELLKTVMRIVGEENCRDDCAILPCGDQVMVATTDMLHKTTDFVDGMTDWQIGWMSAAVTISDIASMGAAPKYLLIAVGLDRWEQLAGVMQGAKDCCTRFGAQIVGGDIDRHGELTVVTTGLGLTSRRDLARREGAWPGDLVCITGVPGQAQAWLDGYKQFEKALFEPQPRVAEGQALARAGVSAMMDDSDGIALSLYDLMSVNTCGFAIDSAFVPRPDEVPEPQARELALYGGGDYELIFTIAPDRYPVAGVPCTVIGTVTEKRSVLVDGRPMEKRGYQHRW
ncbi:thiamine-monophosphate kinase [Methanoregula boonei 6A8]|uniref:Thiamine-monophosphate kinase n=1 Tax=Methanoregula boonei (strain DSM 21154 / JCM 14090 / 6A8) TaxID=456442 RepID=A7IAS2_METB6|nr:thiamine-phosphate kinase [Methanoregula boonei]ABS56833.1 thiamine-monophosphate kinase [Methanoregula boonei 6A8]